MTTKPDSTKKEDKLAKNAPTFLEQVFSIKKFPESLFLNINFKQDFVVFPMRF